MSPNVASKILTILQDLTSLSPSLIGTMRITIPTSDELLFKLNEIIQLTKQFNSMVITGA